MVTPVIHKERFRKIKLWFCSLGYKIKAIKWWVLHRTTHRFHVIKIKSLKPGWYDVDTRLLHSAFTLLEGYVEKENPFKIIEWNTDDITREVANDIHALYYWWQHYKNEPEPDTMEEEDARYKEATDNLIRLAKIRAFLWT